MKEGYLIFTSHDGDEIDATFVEDRKIYDRLCSDEVRDNDDAMMIWNEWEMKNDGNRGKIYTAQAPGDYPWPFNDTKILGTYYIMIY